MSTVTTTDRAGAPWTDRRRALCAKADDDVNDQRARAARDCDITGPSVRKKFTTGIERTLDRVGEIARPLSARAYVVAKLRGKAEATRSPPMGSSPPEVTYRTR